MAWCDEPGFADAQRALLMWRIRRERNSADDPLIGLTEAELFRRIFACDEPERDRT
ncbi:hypothetical protein [Kitasatospora purpeofusca]|uniref:hypothetical protein n=1 Tax=Kitasatospora purpeofusca TaxID=67352 RepID=UPI0012FF43F7|nr:hypothetical protein [Kitasatospora purpeofusca]